MKGRDVQILLRAESEEGTERMCLPARVRGSRFVFGREGDLFSVDVPREGAVHISRRGEISYRLVLEEGAETAARIRTPYGEIDAAVRTLSSVVRGEGCRICLECTYVLLFGDWERRCRITFTARPRSAAENGEEEV